ncbi:M56 family metallopeptidase [Lacinutrix salivirga]
MVILLLKSASCLAILMLFYKLALEKLTIHKFKRFYLLAALIASAGIPFITFIEYIEPVVTSNTLNLGTFQTPNHIPEAITNTEPTHYLPIILWSIYALGVLVFTIRFSHNLYKIISKINSNEKQKQRSYVNVLLQKLTIPHTFLHFIFLDKKLFKNNAIPQEVLLHEQTHARQKHSLDILFIEVLQIVFWFNPLLYFIKKDIKLNHEFLADQAVLKQGFATSKYQHTLLAFSSNQQELALVNAINYSSIKKRFTIMKTQTSKKATWLRSFLILPLLALLVYGFSTTKEVEEEIVPKMKSDANTILTSTHTARSINIEVFKDGTYKIDGIKATKTSFLNVINRLHQDITPEIRNNIINIHVNSPKDISDKEVWFIFNSVQEYGFHRIVAYNQEVVRSKGNTPFAIVNTNHQNTKILVNGIECDGCQLNLSKKSIENLILSTTTNKDITAFKIKFKGKKTESIKGNRLNSTARNNLKQEVNGSIVQLFDIKAGKQKFSPILITLVDKNDPNYSHSPTVKKGEQSPLPPPPPAPPKVRKGDKSNIPPPPPTSTPKNEGDTESGYIDINGETHFYIVSDGKTKYYNRWGVLVDSSGKKISNKQTEGDKVVKGQNITKVYKDNKIISEFKKTGNDKMDSTIPPPPPPMSTIDHVVLMAKKGANFYYNGESITSDKAIAIVKNNTKINISSHTDNGKSTVSLSTNPINRNNRSITVERGKAMEERKQALNQRKTMRKQALMERKEALRNRNSRLPLSERFVGMEANGTMFYYEGEKISEQKAIKLIDENPKLNVSIHRDNSKGTVHLSKKGIKTINGKVIKN